MPQISYLPKAFPLDSGSNLMAGAKAYWYVTLTSTPKDTYTDFALSVANTNPVVADGNGIFPTTFLKQDMRYRLTLKTSADVLIYTQDDVGGPSMNQAEIGLQLYPQTAAEIAAGVTPTAYQYAPGNAWRYGMAGDAGTTTNDTAFQNALNASAGAYPVIIPRGLTGYYKLTGRVTAPANTQIIMQDGAELRWTATTATGTNLLSLASRPGIEITGDNFRLEGFGVLRGPSVATYVENEAALLAIGTSSASRKSGFVVDGQIEFLNWGSYGVALQFVNNIKVRNIKAHDIGQSGMTFLSCGNGRVKDNEVYSITPGTAGTAYGISCSHDSTNYSTDPNIATPRLVANPFCNDFDISYNSVYDIPLWTGIDAHGAYEICAHHNVVNNCYIAIQLCKSSGGANNYAGENNTISYNVVSTLKRDGSATTVASFDAYGINMSGGTTVTSRNVKAIGNVIIGYGLNSVVGGSLLGQRIQNGVYRDNIIVNWQRNAIYVQNFDGIVSGNIFDAVGNASNSRCIFVDSATTYPLTIEHNRHNPHGGTVASEGMRITVGITPRMIVGGNDFESATTPYFNVDDSQVLARRFFAGTVAQRVTVTYSASITIDAQTGNEFDITANNGTAFTINAPTTPLDGQRITITIRNTSGGALGVITWDAVFKMSAWTSPATANSRSIDFKYNGSNWVQVGQTGVDVPN